MQISEFYNNLEVTIQTILFLKNLISINNISQYKYIPDSYIYTSTNIYQIHIYIPVQIYTRFIYIYQYKYIPDSYIYTSTNIYQIHIYIPVQIYTRFIYIYQYKYIPDSYIYTSTNIYQIHLSTMWRILNPNKKS